MLILWVGFFGYCQRPNFVKNGFAVLLEDVVRLKVVLVYRQFIGVSADGDKVIAAEFAVRVNRVKWIGFFTYDTHLSRLVPDKTYITH